MVRERKTRYVSIPVREETYWKLAEVKNDMQFRNRKRDISWDDVMQMLLMLLKKCGGENDG